MKNKIYLVAFLCSLFNLANSQTLLADYPVLTDLVDATGNNSDFTLTAGISGPSDGICQPGGFTDYGISPIIANFDPTSFQIEIDFQANNIPGPINWTPIMIGGTSYRWMGLYWNYNGKLGFMYNNGNFTETAGNVVPGTWYTAVLMYKNNSICILLDGVIVYQNCIVTLEHAGDFNFSTRNFGIGHVIDGCFRNLKISSDPVLPIWTETITEVLCFGDSYALGNNNYSQDGIYTENVVTPLGCVKEVTLNLTIAPELNITASIANDLTITSDQTGDSYLWIDCSNGNQIISGETSQLFTASENGDYAVIVTSGNCSDTSNCVTINTIGMDEINNQDYLVVYPNPSNDGIFFVNSQTFIRDLQIFDVLGREMHINYNALSGEIDCKNLAPGKYTMKLITEKQEFSKVLIIQND